MNKIPLFFCLCLVASVAVAAQPFVELAQGRPVLCVNADNDHYFKARYMANLLPLEGRFSEAGVRKYLDIVAAGGVTHLFLCPVGQRASFDATSCDPIWLAIDEAKARGVGPDEWPVNAKRLHDAGLDAYAIWCKAAREKGSVSVWISMRMNDVHFVNEPWNIRTNRFWYEHPELRRVTDKDPQKGGSWTQFALDYSKKEVQEFEFGIFKELVDRYDADGYELDWMRFWEHLTPGKERGQARILTDFMKRCRTYAQAAGARRGHPVYLSTRVPTSYAAALDFGYDPETWVREGVVEMISVGNFWAADDYDFDFAGWKRRIAAVNPNVTVLPGASDNLCAGPGLPVFPANMAAWRGWADNMYAEGAEGLYFFNVAYKSDDIQRQLYERGLSPLDARTGWRRYPIAYHDCTKTLAQDARQLPVDCDKPVALNVRAGLLGNAKKLEVILAFNVQTPCPEVTLNGMRPAAVSPIMEGLAMYGGKVASCAYALRFENKAGKPGTNALTLASTGKVRLVWAEIAVDRPEALDRMRLQPRDGRRGRGARRRQRHGEGAKMNIPFQPHTEHKTYKGETRHENHTFARSRSGYAEGRR